MSRPMRADEQGLQFACPSCGQLNRVRYGKLHESVRCAKCKTSIATTSSPLDVASSADFDRLIAAASIPVVVDYWATWCGPCRMVAPELEKVAARAGTRYLVVKVDTDALADLSERHSIRSIPAMAVFANGREVARTAGARPASDIEAFIAQAAERARL
jgi:thioredoxin 2